MKNKQQTDDIDSIYIYPKEAYRKIKLAQKMKQPAYLFGVTGIGKTTLIQQVLKGQNYTHYPVDKTRPEDIVIPARGGIVILDNLYALTDQRDREAYAVIIEKLLELPNVWLILISRTHILKWLYPFHIKYVFLTIEEQDFLLTKEEQIQYFDMWSLVFENRQLEYLWKLGQGNPLFLRIIALRAQKSKNVRELDSAIEQGRVDLWDYLSAHVYEQWNMELQEFLMETAIVEEFDTQMATMITGKSNVERLLFEAGEIGNFLLQKENGFYYYKQGFNCSMQRRLQYTYSDAKKNKLFYNAGHCYEIRNELHKAIKMYDKCEDTDSKARVLITNAREHPGSGNYFAMKQYYLALPDEAVEQSPVLMCVMSMLQSMLLNPEQSEYWYEKLTEYARTHKGTAKKEAKMRLMYLDIALPHRGSDRLAEILKNAGTLIMNRELILPEFSVTSNLPSMMNGGKDFCEWTKKDRELAGSIGKLVELAMGRSGKGLVSLALSESFLEKGADNYQVAVLAEKGKMQAESGGRTEQCFVGVGMLVWLSILNGNIRDAEEILQSFQKKAGVEAPQLLPNVEALLCRISLYEDEWARYQTWLTDVPDDKDEFQGMERFRYLTKVRVYIRIGRYEQAALLLQKLLYYAKVCKRTYIELEASILLAIVYFRMQKEWKSLLQSSIDQASEYHFVRLFSREGNAILPLLESGDMYWREQEYKNQVLTECKKMAEFYPAYLEDGHTSEISLSQHALHILSLQARGMTIDQIAALLHISPSTVKYHCRETYRKLGVSDKAAAVSEAKNRKII